MADKNLAKRLGLVFTVLFMVGFFVFALFPLLWILLMSLKDKTDILAYPPKFLFTPTLANYREILLGDYLPQTSQDIEKMFEELKNIASQVRRPFLSRLLSAFLNDEELVKKIKMAPAAKAVHHVFLGGLLEHTLAVAQLVLLVGPRYKGIDQELLLTGAILHDLGKVSELSFDRTFDYTDPGRLLGHITLTAEMLDEKIKSIPDFPQNLAVLLKHIILSHHGEYEFGSPKRPKTLEALLLHQLDDLDAKMNGFMAWIEKEKDTPSRWTSYHKLFDRFIYKPEEEG